MATGPSLYFYNATTSDPPETVEEAQALQPTTIGCDQELGFVIFAGSEEFPDDPSLQVQLQGDAGFGREYTIIEATPTRITGTISLEDFSAQVGLPVQGTVSVTGLEEPIAMASFTYNCIPPPPPVGFRAVVGSTDNPTCGEELTLSIRRGEPLPIGAEITYHVGVSFGFEAGFTVVPINLVPVVVSEENPDASYTFTYNLGSVAGDPTGGSVLFATVGDDPTRINLGCASDTPLCIPYYSNACTDLTTTIVPSDPCVGDEIDVVAGGFPGEGSGTLFTYYFEGNTGNPDSVVLIEEDTCQQTVEVGETVDTCPSIVINENSYGIIQVYYGDDGVVASRSTLITLGTNCGTGGDPHVLCLDNSRIDLYEEGYYRLFDNLSDCMQESIVVNAQVVRDPYTKEDQYRKVWISLLEKDFALEFYPTYLRLRERKRGERTYTELGRMKEWSHSYSSSTGQEYLFQADLSQNTVALSLLGPQGHRNYLLNGLFAGRILPVARIEDCNHYAPVEEAFCAQKYKYNALLCGSAKPHITSFQKGYLPLEQGLYRLVEQEGLLLNVELDQRGALSKALLFINGEKKEEWAYSGSFWEVKAQRNGEVVSTHTLSEHRTPDYLLRIQANGSISFASQKRVRGLFNGEVIPLTSLEDYTPRDVVQTLKGVVVDREQATLYNRLIEAGAQ